jgi:predicted O-methyltransferase YrrM
MRWGALQKQNELEDLSGFLLTREPPKTVLEIGTCRGGTLWLWCRLAAPDALIVSVDLPGGPFGGGYTVQDVPIFLGHAEADQDIQLLAGNSHSPKMLEAVQGKLGDRGVDLLFIDGDHSYDGVKQDWEMYSPLVNPGGIVIFHDIVKHTKFPECQVDRFWRELKPEHDHEEFCAPDRGWAGIGAIHIH